MRKFFLGSVVLAVLAACQPTAEQATQKEQTNIIPAAEGFNAAGSDEKAIAIADSVMLAMGGKQAWDSARYFEFNFFGARNLFVDRIAKKVRIESARTDFKVVADLTDSTGQVFMYGKEQTSPDSIAKFVGVANSMEINDMYWLVFPFKLKDSGVTLTYADMGVTQDSVSCHKLRLTFQEVGDTPDNAYVAYVNPETYMVEQWEYYANYTDSIPAIVSPFENYQDFNGIKISLARGKYKFSDVSVYSTISDSSEKAVFETL